jgi:adenylate kinase
MADSNSEIGRRSTPYMNRGDYIPDDLALQLFFSIAEGLESNARVVLDGFPRTVPQGEALAAWNEQQGHTVTGCVFLELNPEVAAKRMRNRRVCPVCRKTFPTVAGDPSGKTCDVCGGVLIQREDDDPERMARRVRRHEQVTRPLRDWYRSRGRLIELDATLPTEELRKRIRTSDMHG